jgi:hypothetical protein
MRLFVVLRGEGVAYFVPQRHKFRNCLAVGLRAILVRLSVIVTVAMLRRRT